ncbi:MAG: ABC transporter substrate-binding protein [Acholeplasmataceae bacterium]
MKKHLVILLSVLSLIAFSSCKPPEDVEIDEREEKFEEGATKVDMWIHDFEDWNNKLNFDQRMDFNDNLDDGIQLEQKLVDTSSFDDQIRSARETGSEPDIYMVSYGNLYKDIRNGYAADITDLLPASSFDDLYDSARSGVQFDGRYYAYPILFEPSTLLFYNESLLQTYGETTEIPADWDGFLELLDTIKSNIEAEDVDGLHPFDVPKGVGLGWGSWGMQLAATGGLALTEDWSESRLLDPGYEDLARLWQDLYLNRYVPLSSGDYTSIINDLGLEKLVMTTAGSWSIATIINDYPDLVDEIGVAALPTFTGESDVPTATNGGWTYVISESSENKEEAAAVIEYLVAGSTEKPLEFFEGAHYSKTSPRMSVQEAIIDEIPVQSTVPQDWITTLSDVAELAPMEPIYPWDVSVAVSTMLENVALGNSVDQEIDNAHEDVKDLIDANDLAGNNPRGG